MSPGAVTDGAALFYLKKSPSLLPLSPLSFDRSSSVLVNSAAKILRLSLGCHPLLDGVRPLPAPHLVTLLLY